MIGHKLSLQCRLSVMSLMYLLLWGGCTNPARRFGAQLASFIESLQTLCYKQYGLFLNLGEEGTWNWGWCEATYPQFWRTGMVADEKKFLLKYLLAWYLHWNFLVMDCLYSLSMASDNFLETERFICLLMAATSYHTFFTLELIRYLILNSGSIIFFHLVDLMFWYKFLLRFWLSPCLFFYNFCFLTILSNSSAYPVSISDMQPAGWKLKEEYLPSGWKCLVLFVACLLLNMC